MQFNSYEFIFYFLPILVCLYFLANKIRPAAGKLVLIAGSILFYAFGRAEMLIILAISMGINYCSALLIRKKGVGHKFLPALPIIVNVILLGYFKYTNFLLGSLYQARGAEFSPLNIILPLGISFYTFQQIAYIVAVARNELENISLLDYISYILFFPKLVMGPLMEPVDFMTQINDAGRKKANLHNITCGIKIFSLGLIKKVLLADTFARAVSWVYGNFEQATAADCFLLVIFYSFEIYFDFSGYTDMAVGAASMLNIELPINFDSPLKALSVQDFWKRWHLSLTGFFTKYLYFPLGGSRKGEFRTYLNIMIVFIVSGIWHGAGWGFVLWGVFHGLLSCFDRRFKKLEEKVFMPVRWGVSFFVIGILRLLYHAESVTLWKEIMKRMVFMWDTTISGGLLEIFDIPETQFIYNTFHLQNFAAHFRGFNMLVFTAAAFLICLVPENNYRNRNKITVFSLILAIAAFVWGVLCLGSESTFVYFGF